MTERTARRWIVPRTETTGRGRQTAAERRSPARAHTPVGMLVALVLLGTGGCGRPAVRLSPMPHDPRAGDLPSEVWVVRHGWHTRIAVRDTDIDRSVWPERRDVGDGAYFEVGWGDREFYPNPGPSVWDAINPVIRATPAALHVGALDHPAHEVYPGSAVVRVPVHAPGIERLARFIQEHYVRDAAGTPVRIGPGATPRSRFYLARGRYHALTYNSNAWTATALQAVGASITPASAMTAGAVMRQAAEIARRRPRRRPVRP